MEEKQTKKYIWIAIIQIIILAIYAVGNYFALKVEMIVLNPMLYLIPYGALLVIADVICMILIFKKKAKKSVEEIPAYPDDRYVENVAEYIPETVAEAPLNEQNVQNSNQPSQNQRSGQNSNQFSQNQQNVQNTNQFSQNQQNVQNANQFSQNQQNVQNSGQQQVHYSPQFSNIQHENSSQQNVERTVKHEMHEQKVIFSDNMKNAENTHDTSVNNEKSGLIFSDNMKNDGANNQNIAENAGEVK